MNVLGFEVVKNRKRKVKDEKGGKENEVHRWEGHVKVKIDGKEALVRKKGGMLWDCSKRQLQEEEM